MSTGNLTEANNEVKRKVKSGVNNNLNGACLHHRHAVQEGLRCLHTGA
jgi:hypothetical protein